MDRRELERVADVYLGAWRTADWAALEEVLAPTVVFDQLSLQQRIEGRAAVVGVIRQLQQASPPVEITAARWLVDEVDNVIATELSVRRTDSDGLLALYATLVLDVGDDVRISAVRTLYQVVLRDDGTVSGPLCGAV